MWKEKLKRNTDMGTSMSINDVRFKWGGSKMTPKNRTLEGKNRTLGEGESKMTKKSDIIYGCSLWVNTKYSIF